MSFFPFIYDSSTIQRRFHTTLSFDNLKKEDEYILFTKMDVSDAWMSQLTSQG